MAPGETDPHFWGVLAGWDESKSTIRSKSKRRRRRRIGITGKPRPNPSHRTADNRNVMAGTPSEHRDVVA
jgi:hypothetical protein